MLNRLKGILYELTGKIAVFGSRGKPTKKILIVKTDEIGDYMLWRGFLQELIGADRFRDYEVHFCGNSSWKSLFETFDKEKVTQSIWLEKIRFKKDLAYRYQFLKTIFANRYEIVINPIYSRDKRNDDAIVKAAQAKHRIGMVANPESVRSYELGYDKYLYTELFDCPDKPLFEFIRNRLFTEFITGKKSLVENTQVDSARLPALQEGLPKDYFVVFPGSRSKSRIWPAESFSEVAGYLYKQFGWTAILCGGKDDTQYASAFEAVYSSPVINITGKTGLPALLSILKNANCLLSVDTGSVHLAAAVGCTVFGIFNGSQYGRFAPYPESIAPDFHPVYPKEIETELSNQEIVKLKYEFVISIPYDSVKPDNVIEKIKTHFNL